MMRDEIQKFSGAVAGLNFVAVVQLITRDTFTLPLIIAASLMALTTPLLTVFWLRPMAVEDAEFGSSRKNCVMLATFGGSVLISIAAMVLLFWHFSWITGLIAMVSSVAAVFFLFLRVPEPKCELFGPLPSMLTKKSQKDEHKA